MNNVPADVGTMLIKPLTACAVPRPESAEALSRVKVSPMLASRSASSTSYDSGTPVVAKVARSWVCGAAGAAAGRGGVSSISLTEIVPRSFPLFPSLIVTSKLSASGRWSADPMAGAVYVSVLDPAVKSVWPCTGLPAAENTNESPSGSVAKALAFRTRVWPNVTCCWAAMSSRIDGGRLPGCGATTVMMIDASARKP